MAASPHFGAFLARFVSPRGVPPKVQMPGVTWRPRMSMSAQISNVSCHHRGLHFQGSHGGPAPFRHPLR
eukprot:1462412-Pyramimonas_sp.AAC.1